MLRVTAHNNAGFTVAEYEFATLTVNGGKSDARISHTLIVFDDESFVYDVTLKSFKL